MLGLIAGGERQAVQSVFRFTVKCDRAFNRKIEAAAKKAGVSPGEFVQAHFEAIFDRGEAGEGTALRRAATVDPIAFSREHKITLMAARAWIFLASRARDNGLSPATIRELAGAAGSDSVATGSRLRDELVDAQLIEVVQRSQGMAGATYRLCGAP